MFDKPIQDFLPEEAQYCYGCGNRNPESLHMKTYWNEEEGICRFKPEPHLTAGYRGIVYGGLIASLIDCHCIGTAIAASYQAEGREPGTKPDIAFITGSMSVKYLLPSPVGYELVLKARVKELQQNKVIVACSVYAGGKERARGEVVAKRAPERFASYAE